MKSTVFKNTVFLYILTFSNYLFALITLPYETRVLGPEYFGVLGFAAAFYTYFFVVLDFGFILSGTKRVSENVGDVKELGRILTGVTVSKFILFVILFLLLYLSSMFVGKIFQCRNVLFLYLILAFLTTLIPDYLYRGLENMKMVTYRTVLVKFVFTCLIFVFLKHPHQYYLVPLFNIVGTVLALVWVVFDIYKNLNVKFEAVPFKYLRSLLKDTLGYFLSRIASTIYGATNTIIIGFLYPTGNVLGYFTSSDKVRTLASQASSPLADSFYPYMLRTRNYKRLIQVVVIAECLVLTGCSILWCYAEEFCAIVFGHEYVGAAYLLRYMIPLICVVLPNYMLGFPALSPMGLSKWANYSVEISMVSQIIGLALLFVLHKLTAHSVIMVTLFSELLCLTIRTIAFIYGIKESNVTLKKTR